MYSSFLSAALDTPNCIESLENVVMGATSCEACFMSGRECVYESINLQCDMCKENDLQCTSLAVFHVLWDMGS